MVNQKSLPKATALATALGAADAVERGALTAEPGPTLGCAPWVGQMRPA